MRRFIALMLTFFMCCSVCACADNTTNTNESNNPHQTEIVNKSKLYPLNTKESVYYTYTDIPEIIFSTTGSENGLGGTIYSFSGKMVGGHSKLGSSYFVVETKYGKVLMMNVYDELKNSLPIEKECYTTPEIGEYARFTCIYDGFSGVAEMPGFIYGNDSFLLSSLSDSDENTDNKETTTPPTTSNVSLSKQNALKRANSYLKSSAFSYLGLIGQLEYEQFSNEDAVYGADNCGANWNEQALKKAQSYLKHSAFSYSGLIDQLEFEKFTAEQAKYGADNCGADWNEQAAKKAQSYLKHSAFSRKGLIDQLKYEGFTNEQAVYGVNSAGL